MADALPVYATEGELAAYVGTVYVVPADSELLLRDASRLIDKVTMGSAPLSWADPLPDPTTADQDALRDATCAQVEYWLELGREYSVNPLNRVAMGQLSVELLGELAPKARDALLREALLYRGVGVTW